MQTVVALALFALLLIAAWIIYVRSGARRWTIERDPLGEPPVRTVAAVVLGILVVAFLTGGGSGAQHPGSTAQGLSDDDGAFVQAAGEDPILPMRSEADSGATAAPMVAPTQAPGVLLDEEAAARQDERLRRLEARAYEASARRGAKSNSYEALVAKAERASERRRR